MIRKFRISILLLVLFVVATGAWLTHARLTDWDEPIWLVVYPIAGDNSANTASYIKGLEESDLQAVASFMSVQARNHGVTTSSPLKVVMADPLSDLPPAPPQNGSVLSIMSWSLRLRAWAWMNEDSSQLGDVSIFVIYHDPQNRLSVPHSLGLKEGHIGVVHAFAHRKMTGSNNVVIAHEFLHTLGATDKYDLQSNLPLYPDGYVDPMRRPLYPQDKAEIMAGRIPVSRNQADTPRNLDYTLIGRVTAREIGW